MTKKEVTYVAFTFHLNVSEATDMFLLGPVSSPALVCWISHGGTCNGLESRWAYKVSGVGRSTRWSLLEHEAIWI